MHEIIIFCFSFLFKFSRFYTLLRSFCVLVTDACWTRQNRHQKIFNSGALRLCRGFDILKFDKNSVYLICFLLQFGGLGAVFEGDKPPPVTTDLGPGIT